MSIKSKRRVRRSKQEWREIVSRFESSELRSEDFCRAEGVSLPSLKKWRSHFASGSKNAFVEITPSLSTNNRTSIASVELQFPSGLVLRVN